MGRIVLDTSVLIAANEVSHERHTIVFQYLNQTEDSLIISAVSLSEFMVHPLRRGNKARPLKTVLKFVDEIVSVDVELAVLAAEIRAEHNLKLPDAIISATAIISKGTLVTLDQKLARMHKGAVLLK
jgi:predicted nucleic acid-binding protein